jgi:hypothetical protein
MEERQSMNLESQRIGPMEGVLESKIKRSLQDYYGACATIFDRKIEVLKMIGKHFKERGWETYYYLVYDHEYFCGNPLYKIVVVSAKHSKEDRIVKIAMEEGVVNGMAGLKLIKVEDESEHKPVLNRAPFKKFHARK